jgi:Ser/Thr protein kinase RdoA (MazF antagonist)
MGWDESKLEDRERRRAVAAARPVRKAIDEDEAAMTMLASKGGAVSAKKLRKDKRRAVRAAGAELEAEAPAAASSSTGTAAARPSYSFDDFF